jgi:wobble nucleotide-excising tRNase
MNLWNKQKGQVVEFQPQEVDTAPSEVEQQQQPKGSISERASEHQNLLVANLERIKDEIQDDLRRHRRIVKDLENELEECEACLGAADPAAKELDRIAHKPKLSGIGDIVESLKTEADKTPRLDEIDKTQAVE